ncbi:hypothetical protein HG531_000933 [Fusarium graminearum]|nr:hypothetical protein HG531_000933 [Fusarium graminearum]
MLTLNNRSDPDSVEAHALDVVQLGLKTLKGATAIISEIATGIATAITITACNTICEGKVNVSRLPGVCISCAGEWADGSHQGGKLKKLHGQQKG